MFKRFLFSFSFIGLIGTFHFFCPETSDAKIFYRKSLKIINTSKPFQMEISDITEDDFRRDRHN